jgi:hypothetical protein
LLEPGWLSQYNDQAMGLTSKVEFPAGKSLFVSVIATRRALRPIQPLIQGVLGVKRSGHEAYHSPPASAEVKMRGAILSLLPKRLRGMALS